MTHCRQFRDSLEEITQKIEGVDTQMQSFLAQGTIPADFQKNLANAYEYQQQLQTQYQEQAKQLILQWRKNLKTSHFFDERQIDFEPSQRIVLTIPSTFPFEGRHFEYFPSLIRKVDGSIQMRSGTITTMDYLEEVTGKLILKSLSQLRSLARLRFVRGYFVLEGTKVQSLDAFEEAGDMFINDVPTLVSMKNLRRVYGGFDLRNTGVTRLESLEETGEVRFHNEKQFTALPKLKKAGGVYLYNSGVRDLPELEEIERGLSLAGVTSIHKVPKLKRVGWGIDLRGTLLGLPNASRLPFFRGLNKIKFSDMLPSLTYVRGYPHSTPYSFIVSTDEAKREIEKHQREKGLAFNGPIIVDPSQEYS